MKKLLLFFFFVFTLLNAKSLYLSKGKNEIINDYFSIDINKTFTNKDIKYITTYDPISKNDATFPFKKNKLKLQVIEKGVKFIVYSNKNQKINIVSRKLNKVCKEYMKNNNFNYLIDSNIDNSLSISTHNNISLSSRYYSNELKGIYSDTNVMLIYPKIKKTSQIKYNYGPAVPKIKISYSKEYEGKKFYIYDFFQQSCYEGYFPSPKILPFRELKRLTR